MAGTGNLGEYKVVISASYEQFAAQLQSVSQMIKDSAVNMSSQMNSMSDSISSSLKGMTDGIKSSMEQSAASINSMKSSLNGVDAEKGTNSVKRFRSESEKIPSAMRQAADSTSTLNSALGKIASHFEWLATAGLVGGLLAIPAGINSVVESTDALNAKIRQNLELSDKYHGNNQLLDSDMQRLTQTAQTYAVGFGANLNEVQEAMQILSRRFKDVESVSYLTSVALTMNRLDFVDLKKAATDLEAVMLQFGLSAQGTKTFLNDFTVAVHTARVTGTDLLDALERSGSAFKGFNMGTRESIAAVAALSTETARTGSTIGQSFKSIASNFDTKKAVEALDAYGIKLYEVNENGMKSMRQGANIFGELQNLFAKLDDEGQRKLAMALSGGKYQVNAMMAFLADANQNFSKIMSEMQNKSSDAMTQQLLAVSMETYQTKIAQLKASLQVLAQTLGNQVLPSLKNFAVFLTGSVMWLQQHANTVLSIAKILVVLAGSYIAAQISIGLASVAVGTYNIVMAACTGTVSLATVGTWAFNAANIAATASTIIQIGATEGLAAAFDALWVSMGPIGWAVLAIIVLGTAIYEVYTHWDSVKPALINIWNEIVEVIAEAVEIILTMFPQIALEIYVIQEVWTFVINYLSQKWSEFTAWLADVCTVIKQIISDVSSVWEPFVEGARQGIAGFANAISDLVTSILPDWANKVLSIFAQLASKIASYAKSIGDSIRNTLSIAAGAGASVGSEAGNGEESPFEKAQRLANASYQASIPQIPDLGGISAPSMGNQIPTGKNGSKGRKGSTKKEESPYKQAKEAYEEAVAESKYQTEAVEGKKFTSNDQLYLYNSYLTDVTKSTKETNDFLKGQFDLMTKSHKEQLAIQKADLDKQVAAEKLTKRQAYEEEIELLQKEADATLEGSVERIKAETAVINKKREYENHLTNIAKKEAEIVRKYSTDMQELINKQIEFNEKMGLISKPEMIAYKNQQNESTFAQKNSSNEEAVVKTAQSGQEGAMLDAYRQYTQAKTEAERKAAEDIMLSYTKQDTKLLEILDRSEEDYKKYTTTKEDLEQQAFEYINRYQISFKNAYVESVESALEATFNRTRTWAENMRNIFKSLWGALAKQLSTDIVTPWSQSMSKILLHSKKTNDQQKSNSQSTANQLEQDVTKVATATISADTQKQISSKTTSAMQKTDSASTKTSVMSDLGTMLAQMLEEMAIMYVLSALFGGGGSSTSTSTSTVSLGRNPGSYYTTPSTISQITVPSMDIGGELPSDMLIQAHKGEWVLTPDQVNSIKSVAASNNSSVNNTRSSNIVLNSNFNPSLIDSRGIKDVYNQTSKDMIKTIKQEYRRFNTQGLTNA